MNQQKQPKLLVFRGYSASGKSTRAREWVTNDPANRARANRDDLRVTIFGEEGVLSNDKESIITEVQRAIVKEALQSGKDVVLDDTNLRRKYAVEWATFVTKLGFEFEVHDFEVPLEVCLERNKERADAGGRYVPEDAIRNQAKKFPYPWPSIEAKDTTLSVEPYVRAGMGPVYLVDIDGTVALMGDRSPFAWNQVGLDTPRMDVIRVVEELSVNARIIFLSGRDGSCREETLKWLRSYVRVGEPELYMREAGDNRPDYVVKHELFNKHARHLNIRGVFDDRPQVVRLWHELGLTVFNVGDGTEF